MSATFRHPARNDGRATSAATGDLRSFTDLARTLVRYAPFIVGLTLLAAVGTGVFAKSTASSVSAKARIVLTSRVVWPYYDAIRDKQVETIAEPSTFAEVAKRIADVGTLKNLASSVPTGQAFVDIEATASSSAAAIAAANAAADYIVELNRKDVLGQLQAKHDQAVQDLAAIDKNVDDMTAQLTALEPRIAALSIAIAVPNPTAANITEIRQLENQRTSLLEHRSVETSRRGGAIFSADTASTDLRNASGQVDVLRRAFTGATDPGRTKGLIALAAIVAAFAATMLAIGFDASYQRIRSRRHAATGGGRGLPIVSAIELDSDSAYVNRLLEMREPGEILGVASAFGTSSVSARAVSGVAGALARTHTTVVSFGESAASGDSAERLVLADALGASKGAIDHTVEQIRAMLARTPHVHIETDRYLKAGAALDSAERLRDFVEAVAGLADVVILDCGITSDASSRWRSFAGVCDVIVVLVETGRTRQSELRRAVQTAQERPIRQVGVSIGIPHVIVPHKRRVLTQ